MRKSVIWGVMLLLIVGLAGCGGQPTTELKSAEEAQKVLKVGTDATYKPFEFRDQQNQIVGFDMDLMEAICAELGMKFQPVDTAWDGIIPGLLNGKYDLIVSGMTITEERAKSVLFSAPYFDSGQGIAILANNTAIKGPDDLDGKKIGVQLNTTGDLAVTEKVKAPKEIKRYNVIPDAFVALGNKEVEVVVADVPVLLEYQKTNPGKVKILEKVVTREQLGFAAKPDQQEFIEKINAALQKLKENGQYDEIYTKWFGAKPKQ